ncbi:uncharacterized protein HD556DRAFT_851307 [Suillus plorans]|uniref:Secreted protein n=1 Tax=Suillus plorans TaxID=116603 RepID=A0A9P7DDQ1_9AGAM|nr:uncharacterized protein HD556DRAFT_851307 [Suillus plorans]KAG1788695.1 hypothetical protein HD556DRAFT_851307 [Suillus plorans]
MRCAFQLLSLALASLHSPVGPLQYFPCMVVSALGSGFVISSFATRFVTSDQSNVCLCNVRILRSYHCLWYYKYYNFVQQVIDT